MIVWQANLGRGVSPTAFVANLRAVLQAGGPRAVYLWQEIDEADRPEEMDRLHDLTDKTHHMVGGRTSVPISVPRHLPVLEEHVTVACDGLALFTPRRHITEAVVRLGDDLAPGVLGTHLPIDRPQTATRRAEVRKALRARALRHDAGLWAADTNTRSWWPAIVNGEVPVTTAGIDRAKAWAPPDRKVTVTDHRRVLLSIDGHDAYGARIRWDRVAP